MADAIQQRPSTVTFGDDIQFARRGSRSYSLQHDKRDIDSSRRQSIKYQYPNPVLEAEIKDSDVDSDVDEEEIRRHVFGKPIREMSFTGIDTSVRRPTVSSARHSVIWSHDRKVYEDRNKQDVEEFKNQPYMRHEYPSLRKHYPGTWKTMTHENLRKTTDRLTHVAPTAASLHLHRYHSLLYKLMEERQDHVPKINIRKRPHTSVI